MAVLKPFRMLRPNEVEAAKVCAPPYDVMTTEEARQMAEGNPLSFLRVTRAELEMDDSADPYSHEVYERGAANLKKLVEEGHLVREETPIYMMYRLVMGSHAQTGIVAAASCKDYDEDVVKKHELTRPDKENDRTHHINILGAQTGAVFLTYRSTARIDKLFKAACSGNADIDFTSDDGIRHTAWFVRGGEQIAEIQAAFAEVPALYVADGHHRSAAASRVARERASRNPNHTGKEDYNYFLTVTFPHDQVQVLGYNRVVAGMAGLHVDDFLRKLKDVAEISDAPDGNLPTQKGEVTMNIGGRWRLLRWKPELAERGNTVARLDASLLQDHVLGPLLKVGDPRKDKRIRFVGGIRGTKELERLVDSGDYAVAFALYPTSVDDMMRIANEGGLMPPKSTWFEPKLRDAMAIHVIED